jgi:lipoprotein LprG
MTIYAPIARRIALLAALVLLVSGCGEPPDLTPEQVIEKAAPALQAANSFHFALETSKLQKPMPGLFVSGAEGDVVKPDKLKASVNALFGGLPINVQAVVDGQSQYMTDPASGRWMPTSAAVNVMQFFDPAKGVADILGSVKDPRGEGRESVDGTDSYKLSGTVPTSALSSFSPEVTAQGELSTTLWVGTGDFLLRRVRLQGPLAQGEPVGIVRTITFKDYNKDIKIETPEVKSP